MNVWLDDQRPAPHGWVRTTTAADTIMMLQKFNVTTLSLDHDLGNEWAMTGMDVLKWIEREVFLNGYKPPVILIHTMNAGVQKRMHLAVDKIYEIALKNEEL